MPIVDGKPANRKMMWGFYGFALGCVVGYVSAESHQERSMEAPPEHYYIPEEEIDVRHPPAPDSLVTKLEEGT